MTLDITPSLAVVPIFVNAGTALIPAIIAPLASVLALLLRPRELLRTFRRRPVIPITLAASGIVVWLGVSWAWSGRRTPPVPAGRQQVALSRIDWVREAMDIIRRESAGGPTTIPTTQRAASGDRGAVFRVDYSRCGHDGGPAPLALRPLWQYQSDGAMFLSSPTIYKDRVYGASCTIDPIAGNFGTIFCLAAADGRKPLWVVSKLDNEPIIKPFFSSPAISPDGKYLLIGQGLHDDADSYLICLETDTGKLHWRVKTPLHIEGSPAVWKDMVVAGAGAIEGPDLKPTTDPGCILAVRISDGHELWRYRVNDPESSPAISPDGIIYIGSGYQGNAVVALRGESDDELKAKGLDRLLWKTSTPYPATGAVTLVDDLVIIGGGKGDYVNAAPDPAGIVMALDAKTGQTRWSTKLPDAILGAVAVRDGKVICPVRNGEVAALKLCDGTRIWQRCVSERAPILAAPAFTGKHIYVVSKDGYLSIVRAEDGGRIERHYLNDESNPGAMGLTLSSPTVAAGCVFVGSETGGLRCFSGGRVAE